MKNYNYYMKVCRYHLLAVMCLLLCASCEDFLDERQEMKIVIPNSLQHLRAMLDNNSHVNFGICSGLLEMGTDDYEISRQTYNGLSEFERNAYTFNLTAEFDKGQTFQHWGATYVPVFVANTVLDYVDKVKDDNKVERDRIRGTALFLRAFAFYNTAQLFSPVYTPDNVGVGQGIPLRLTSDFNDKSVRSSVHDTYERIILDLQQAVRLLPDREDFATRPTKAAAWGMLARTKMLMADYRQALAYADSALSLNSYLMDYKEVPIDSDIPFSVLNKETVFMATSSGANILNPNNMTVDRELVETISSCDLRRKVFLKARGDEYTFKGSYNGSNDNSFFTGITTSELFLIKAECAFREGDQALAYNSLKSLYLKRYDTACLSALPDKESLRLKDILAERRRELMFRGLRWTDLRRLNQDPEYAVTVRHKLKDGVDEEVFTLIPNDLRYIYLIPQYVIDISGMTQNRR